MRCAKWLAILEASVPARGIVMAAFMAALFLAALPVQAEGPAPPAIPPITADAAPAFKYLHFLAGLSLGLFAVELVGNAGVGTSPAESPWLRPMVAVGAAAIAGTAKEVLDASGFGDPRFSDMVVTTVGGLAAAGIAAYAQSLYPPSTQGRANSAAFLLSTAGVLAVPVVIGFAREVSSWLERRRKASAAAADPFSARSAGDNGRSG